MDPAKRNNLRSFAEEKVAGIIRNDPTFRKVRIKESGFKGLTASTQEDFAVWVNQDLEEALAAGKAAIHIIMHCKKEIPVILIDRFAGRIKLEFKSENAAFILERCQNFQMEGLFYDNAYMEVGRMTSCNSCTATVLDSSVVIGEDCMISHNVVLQPSDQHDIFSEDTGGIVNVKRNITVGNHVWVGKEAFLGAGAHLEDNSIVAARSVVVGHVPSGCIFGGNPAKQIRSGVNWSRGFTRLDKDLT